MRRSLGQDGEQNPEPKREERKKKYDVSLRPAGVNHCGMHTGLDATEAYCCHTEKKRAEYHVIT